VKLLNTEDAISISPNKKTPSHKGTPKQRPSELKGKFGAISDLENKLIAAERQNKEL